MTATRISAPNPLIDKIRRLAAEVSGEWPRNVEADRKHDPRRGLRRQPHEMLVSLLHHRNWLNLQKTR
jgi:hypothetical protein